MINIAIDGPGGAGKSTVAREAAERMGLHYVDTGAMYRGLGYYLLSRGVDISREDEVEKAVASLDVQVTYTDEGQQVWVEGENMTPYIRTPEAGDASSRTAVYGCVRERLLQLQRDLAACYDVIMDGRDIGTNILPQADLKVYLTADPRERGRRRYREFLEKGRTDVDLEQIIEDIRRRDERDMNRAIAPLCQAEDARLLDTTHMTREEVVDQLCRWIAPLQKKEKEE